MKIVVAYSGGLDTSVILNWIKETYHAEVIAFCADIGQEEELKGLKHKALRTGASKCFVDDLQEEFAKDFIYPMMQAGALYEGEYFLGTSIARPLIAKRTVPRGRGMIRCVSSLPPPLSPRISRLSPRGARSDSAVIFRDGPR